MLNPEGSEQFVNLDHLRNQTWGGIPEILPSLRCEAWKLLLDYMPIDTTEEFRQETLRRKRDEYKEMVHNYFGDF